MNAEEGIRRILRRIEPVQYITYKNADECCKHSTISDVFDVFNEYFNLVSDICDILREVDE